MQRMFTLGAAVSAFLALSACQKAGVADPLKLVPDEATMIAGIDLAGVMGSKLYQDNKERLEQDQEALQFLAASKDCNLDPAQMKGLTMGIDPDTQNFVTVLAGTGVGKEENLSCIHGKIKEKAGQDPWTVEEKDGNKLLKFTEGDAIGHIVGSDVLAMTSAGWSEQVKQLAAGKGKPAVDNSLKALYDGVDRTKHVWFVGTLPEAAKMGLKAGPGKNVQDLSASVDLSAGLALKLAAGVGSEDNAKALQGEAQKAFDQNKAIAAMLVGQGVIDGIKLGQQGASFTAEATISPADLQALQEKLQALAGGGGLGGLMGGGGGGGGAPPPGMQVQMGAPPAGAAPAAPAATPAAPAAAPAAAPDAPQAPPAGGEQPAPSPPG